MSRQLVLVKHALPVLDGAKLPREWILADEGENQARRLALTLRRFLPFGVLSSPEPKALRTAELLALELGATVRPVVGLEEFDRPALPLMSAEEYDRLNAEIFARPTEMVLGRETASEAVARFTAALMGQVSGDGADNVVVVAHGTVISLFVGQHNAVAPYDLWKRLQCPSFVVLWLPSLVLGEVVSRVA
jgi:broad specificity phosphatase PhoE